MYIQVLNPLAFCPVPSLPRVKIGKEKKLKTVNYLLYIKTHKVSKGRIQHNEPRFIFSQKFSVLMTYWKKWSQVYKIHLNLIWPHYLLVGS